MTPVLGLRTCALALCLVTVARAQPSPDATSGADSQPAWSATCSLNVHGTTMRWAVGDSGKVIKRVSGGISTEYVLGRGQFDLLSVSFADAKRGWIVGNKREDPECGRGVVFSTITGGAGPQAWTASCPVVRPGISVPFLKVQALDIRHVWVTCGEGYMLYSNDGGVRWVVAAKRSSSAASGIVGSDHEQ